MGSPLKLLMLLSSPFPLLYPRPSAIHRLILHSRVSTTALSSHSKHVFSSTNPPRRRGGFSINSNQSSQPIHTSVFREEYHSRVSHPWPEWSSLLENLRLAGYVNDTNNPEVPAQLIGEDALAVYENLPQDFVYAASACLSFARQWPQLLGSLARKDIEIVVEYGSPFLFKSAMDSTRRMRSFLGNNQNNNELAFESAHLVDLMQFLLSHVYNPVVSDQKNLSRGELVESSVRNLLGELARESRKIQEPGLSVPMPNQFPDEYGQASRPFTQKIEMKRGDWICPKCSFMNFSRNMECLECNETRPKRQLTGGEWDCPQCNFYNYGRNVVCLRCDCKRPGDTFASGGPRIGLEYSNENEPNTLTNRTPSLEQRMGNAQYQGTLGHTRTPEQSNFQSVEEMGLHRSSGTSTSQNLDRILGRASEGSKSEHVPFRPLPSDKFSKPEEVTNNSGFASDEYNGMKQYISSSDSLPLSRKPVKQAESKEDKEQAEKSERWFKKVAELHDVTDIASAISDEDFPEIMPMRKGENRFVVSKKKDRSLTSPLNKRKMAMEQTSNTTNFVPFVPFPPDYFAKKDKGTEPDTSTRKDTSEPSASVTPEIKSAAEESGEQKAVPPSDDQQHRKERFSTPFSRNTNSENRATYSYENSNEAATDMRTGSRQSRSSGSWEEKRSSSTSGSAQQSANSQSTTESWRGGFPGKSLEGSLVKETDPLDMSEEAKAERWFRRAAQIKDISELSQIPDEDFPQIMPMRKGVNRFVVSKRKTPLERRLTSPQYRRNSPTVRTEPVKEENTES